MSAPPVSKTLTASAGGTRSFAGRYLSLERLPRSLGWLVLWLAAGCGGPVDNLPRQAVSGTVTLDGKPLDRGTLSFQPVSQLPTAAAVSVSGGQYSIAQAEGLVPGSYRVLISSTPQTASTASRPPPPGQATPPPKEMLPEKYNVSSSLTAEVKEGTPNRFDFPLESAPKK
jgi:hypothetical protein